jgi:hypothetical protein
MRVVHPKPASLWSVDAIIHELQRFLNWDAHVLRMLRSPAIPNVSKNEIHNARKVSILFGVKRLVCVKKLATAVCLHSDIGQINVAKVLSEKNRLLAFVRRMAL